jgi:hypothetical protein
MSMIVIGLLLPIQDKDGALFCMMFIDCRSVVFLSNGIKIPGIQLFQYQNRKYTE